MVPTKNQSDDDPHPLNSTFSYLFLKKFRAVTYFFISGGW